MKEIRSVKNLELRVKPESRSVEGYALKFNKESNDLGGFKEIISPKALDGVLERSDILCLYNHIESKVLARNTRGNGSLKLEVDDTGLRYSFDAPKTQLGDTLLENIKRGDLRNSSFAFTVNDEGQKWEKRDDGSYIRTISQFKELYDTSPCFRPAYSETTVAARSFESAKNEIENMLRKEDEEKEKEKDEKLNNEPEMPQDENEDEVVDDTIDEKAEDEAEEKPVDDEVEEPEVEDEEEEKKAEEETDEEEVEEEAEEELIEIQIDGESYNVPKSILVEYIDSRNLEQYHSDIEKRIAELKK